MYNYSATLTYKHYDSDILYRKELLDCFNQTEYDDDISKIIDKIYSKHGEKYNNILLALKDTGNVLFTSLPNSKLLIVKSPLSLGITLLSTKSLFIVNL